MQKKENLEVKEEISNKQEKIGLYILIIGIITIIGIIIGFVITNNNYNKDFKNTENEEKTTDDSSKINTKYLWCDKNNNYNCYLNEQNNNNYSDSETILIATYSCESSDCSIISETYFDNKIIVEDNGKIIVYNFIDKNKKEIKISKMYISIFYSKNINNSLIYVLGDYEGNDYTILDKDYSTINLLQNLKTDNFIILKNKIIVAKSNKFYALDEKLNITYSSKEYENDIWLASSNYFIVNNSNDVDLYDYNEVKKDTLFELTNSETISGVWYDGKNINIAILNSDDSLDICPHLSLDYIPTDYHYEYNIETKKINKITNCEE